MSGALALDRPLPQAPDAERAVLGGVLISPKAFARVAPICREENFVHEGNRLIFAAMLRLAARGIEVDHVTLRDELGASFARVGGASYISSLVGVVPDVTNIERYAVIVREKAESRAILSACHTAMREILDGGTPTSVASSLRFGLAGIGSVQDGRSRGIGDVAETVRRDADARAQLGRSAGVRTGFSSLDRITGGLRRRNFSLFAGRTSQGKTAFLVNALLGAVETDPGVRAALYSLEMAEEPMVNVIRSRISGVPLQRISEWESITDADRGRILETDEHLATLNGRFFFNDRLTSIDDVCADARRLKEEHGLDLIAVDYLQLLRGYENEKVRERVVNQLGKQLFELAKEIDVAAVALSQVTRPGSDRLSLDDLRESKAIGHDAWLVVMLNRPWQAHKDAGINLPCDVTVQIEKNRGGRTGDLSFHFRGATQTFTEESCPGQAQCAEARLAAAS